MYGICCWTKIRNSGVDNKHVFQKAGTGRYLSTCCYFLLIVFVNIDRLSVCLHTKNPGVQEQQICLHHIISFGLTALFARGGTQKGFMEEVVPVFLLSMNWPKKVQNFRACLEILQITFLVVELPVISRTTPSLYLKLLSLDLMTLQPI